MCFTAGFSREGKGEKEWTHCIITHAGARALQLRLQDACKAGAGCEQGENRMCTGGEQDEGKGKTMVWRGENYGIEGGKRGFTEKETICFHKADLRSSFHD